MKQLRFNPQVYDDLAAIKEYISEDDPLEARRVIQKILNDIERLRDFPESGAKLSGKVGFDVKHRYILTYSYVTIYTVEDDFVTVTTIVHGARDFSSLKF